MNASNDFDTIKRKLILAYHQDGILDIVVGSVILGFGLNMLTGNIVFLMFGWLVMMLYIFLKQRITIPRFGYVRFESQEKSTTRLWLLLGIGVLVLFIVFLGGYFLHGNAANSPEMQSWLQQYHMVPLSGLLFGLPTLAVAVFLNLKRFYLYALLAVGLPALGAWLDIPTFAPIIATGVVILGFGFGLLASFLKRYPAADKDSSNVGE
ncbi:MAG: hypothetical protein ACK2U1_09840 [Anaerolineales bacterium]|jgi:hypothetical protein